MDQMNVKEISLEDLVKGIKIVAPHGHKRFTEIVVDLAILHSQKNKDYGGIIGPFGNFERIAELLKIYPLFNNLKNYPSKIAIIYMLKHFDAILSSLSEDRELNVEGLSSRLKDIAVYSILISLMIEEGK